MDIKKKGRKPKKNKTVITPEKRKEYYGNSKRKKNRKLIEKSEYVVNILRGVTNSKFEGDCDKGLSQCKGILLDWILSHVHIKLSV